MTLPDNIPDLLKLLKGYSEDPYYDLRAASVYSCMAVSTIRSYIKSGNLPAYKVGGKVLIKRSELDSWIKSFRINRKQSLNELVNGVLDGLESA